MLSVPIQLKYVSATVILMALVLVSCSKDSEGPTPIQQSFECEVDAVVAKENRLVGLDILDLSKTGNFGDNVSFAKQLGVDFIGLHLPWATIETSANNFSDPGSALALLGQVASDNNFKFSLTIRPIDLIGKTVPNDLENTRFNDLEMIDRFNNLIDFVFTKVDPSVLLNLQIGNEIDGFDTTNEAQSFWEDYGAFLKAVTEHVHSSYPELKVGFTGTLPGLLENPSGFNDLLQNVDILGATYYPLKSNFDVKDPETVFEDLNALVSAFPNKPIYLQEVGYQSSSLNNSSESKQAAFYCNFFAAWDNHKDHIVTANLIRLHDYSQLAAEEGAGPYGISDTVFIEYLRTLGLRNYAGKGSEKQAFAVIHDNLSARGW